MSGRLGDGPLGVALGQVASHHNLLPLVLEGLGHGPAGDRPGLVEGLSNLIWRDSNIDLRWMIWRKVAGSVGGRP